MTKSGQVDYGKMTIGQKIRDLRESAGMLQRELAGHLQVGDSYISKVESDQKVLKKEHLKTVSDLFDCPYSELLTLWLADKVYDLVKNENPAQAIEVLKVAEQEIKYGKRI